MNSPLTSLPLPRWQERVARAFSRAAPRYDDLASAQRDIGEVLWQTLPESAQHVLDLGCGTGYWTQRLAEHYPDAAITGLDLAPGMLAHAQAQYGDAIRWQQGDAAALPLSDASVDLVFSNLAIQWCPDIGAVMQELARVLAPGGQARITTLLPGTLGSGPRRCCKRRMPAPYSGPFSKAACASPSIPVRSGGFSIPI